MFELLSILLGRRTAGAAGSAADHFGPEAVHQKTGVAGARLNRARRALATLVRQQRAEMAALNHLRSRRSALEDRVRQALAADSNDVAANGARAIADLDNDEAARMRNLALLDEKIIGLRHAVAREHHGLHDHRENPAEAIEDIGRWLARNPAEEDRSGVESGKVRVEDVLVRLRTTPAPTTQYSSP